MIAVLFGALKAGAVFVPIHCNTPLRTVRHILNDCRPSALVVDADRWRDLREVLLPENCPTLCIGDEAPGEELAEPWSGCRFADLVEGGDSAFRTAPAAGDLAIIIYTSGSTGVPRGVMLPHGQVAFAVKAINSVLRNSPEDVILCGLPLSFDYGLYQIFLAFHASATLALETGFSVPIAIPRLLSTLSITGFPAVPAIIAMLLRTKLLERVELPNLRYVTSTGDVFPAAHIRSLRRQLPGTTILPMYGLTECKRVSIMPPDAPDAKTSSVGLPLPGTRVEVVGEDFTSLPPGATGQLVVRGPHVMAGYWNAPADTTRRFRPEGADGQTALYTGDLFRIDADGYLFFVGRDETMIKSLGHRISAVEVENAACEIPGVAEAAAFGVPDSVRGETVHLVVFPEKGAKLSPDSLGLQLRESLSPAARPTEIIVSNKPLPRTNNGKIQRSRLAAERQTSTPDSPGQSTGKSEGACGDELRI
jgi:acyl-CoA synthetase (AMP-forming)/AMP-acid ligase II